MKMKNLFLITLVLASRIYVFSQGFEVKTFTSEGFSYESVTNDPLNARIYTLKNGLKVYLSVYKNAPRIQTFIAVKAGSKNDPSNVTGLAHYLEHMVFKGTSKLGTQDWSKEKPLLDKVEALYEKYRATKNETERKKLYRQIDSVSGIAAKYAVANEYDKVLSAIGAQGTNAYTWVEQTVYVNDIPSNEVERWLKVESERFGELTPRLFHTELEAVYEEKNRSLDNDMNKVFEATFNAMFPNHQYGSQTTIGTVEHLKNPSITEIKKYFYTYYVPNNMAICLSGDFDPDKTIKLIDKYWGGKKPQNVPNYVPFQEKLIDAPIVRNVYGPSQESVTLCFRFPGAASADVRVMEMFSKILSNGKAGVLDLNLIQKQKVLSASVFPYSMKDYSINLIMANAKEGQSLEQVRDLVLGQIDSIKQGKFDENLIQAIINNEKIAMMKYYESNETRADMMVDAFIKGMDWKIYVENLEAMAKLSKQDIVAFANKYYGNNYAVVYKRKGVDSTTTKVEKPEITPVDVNREAKSKYFEDLMSGKSEEIKPVFLDYNKDLSKLTLKNGIQLNYKKNEENKLFELNFIFDLGNENDPKYGFALSYLNFLGTSKKTAEQIKTEFYTLGCSYGIGVSSDKIVLSLNGLDENFEKALLLFESLLSDPKADELALQNLVQNILKQRNDAKLDKANILRNAMVSYAKFGTNSPFTNFIPKDSLLKIKSSILINIIKSLSSFKHKALYYGPKEAKDIQLGLEKNHIVASVLKEIPLKKEFKELDFTQNEVYWVDYDMVQAEMLFLSKSVSYDVNLIPKAVLYNEYFGGGMGSIVFQEIRESKALAYSASSRYSIAKDKKYSNYDVSYIGTQADKLAEAMTAMKVLIDKMPISENLFSTSKDAIINNISTERITKSAILTDYENAQKMGLDFDLRSKIYAEVQKFTSKDIVDFHNKYVKDNKTKVLVIGKKDKIDFKALEKYGTVKQLTLEQIFGY